MWNSHKWVISNELYFICKNNLELPCIQHAECTKFAVRSLCLGTMHATVSWNQSTPITSEEMMNILAMKMRENWSVYPSCRVLILIARMSLIFLVIKLISRKDLVLQSRYPLTSIDCQWNSNNTVFYRMLSTAEVRRIDGNSLIQMSCISV